MVWLKTPIELSSCKSEQPDEFIRARLTSLLGLIPKNEVGNGEYRRRDSGRG